MSRLAAAAALTAALAATAGAQTQIAPGVLRFGDADCMGLGCYGSANPTTGVALTGLAAGATSVGTRYLHGFPFAPTAGDFAGTDQIFVGSSQTAFRDGYSQYSGRQQGPQVLTLDYGALLAGGGSVTGLTLGIAADDFEFSTWGNPFTARINGTVSTGLSALLNSLVHTGPYVQFVSFGVDPSLLVGSNVLTLSIDQAGNGADGWSIDFLTVGITTAQTTVPEPSTWALVGTGLATLGGLRWRRRRR